MLLIKLELRAARRQSELHDTPPPAATATTTLRSPAPRLIVRAVRPYDLVARRGGLATELLTKRSVEPLVCDVGGRSGRRWRRTVVALAMVVCFSRVLQGCVMRCTFMSDCMS